MTSPVVHIVDDDSSFLTALSRLLTANNFVVKTFSSGPAFLEQLPHGAAGCVISDLQMPDMSGLDLQEALLRTGKVMPVIILTSKGEIPDSVHAMRKGAEDFLEKHAPKENIIAAVQRALARASEEIAAQADEHLKRSQFDGLSVRQMQVLQHLVRGKLNKQIAGELGITVRTVKFHRAATLAKMQVVSVAELTRLAHESGLFESPPIVPRDR